MSSNLRQVNNQVYNFFADKRFLLFFLWFALTAINVNKAFHIDDVFHLQAAEWIAEHPLTPMSGMVNWDQWPEPIYNFNQPPLFFYLIAAVNKLVGDNEIVMHLFLSFFTFLALWFFSKLSEVLQLKNQNLLLFFFGFNTAFIVNQNLMTDVPLISLVLGFVYFLIKAKYEKSSLNYVKAALLLSAALLVKYSVLPLLLVMPIVMMIRRDYRHLTITLIPILMLTVWSFFNYHEYAAIHIFGRARDEFQPKHFWDFINCLGAVSAFSILFVYGMFPYRFSKWFIVLCHLIFLFSIFAFVNDSISKNTYTKYLVYGFTVNGLLICLPFAINMSITLKKNGLLTFLASDKFVLLLSMCGLSLFIILFAPFLATRHLLLALPFILMLSDDLIANISSFIRGLAIFSSIVLGLALSISDWLYADYYRSMAKEIGRHENKTTWSAGHWGWQWYAKKNGMLPYDIYNKNIKAGDILVYPGNVSIQAVDKSNARLLEKRWHNSTALSFFSVDFARLYSSGIDLAVWNLSKKTPLDTFYIYEFTASSAESK